MADSEHLGAGLDLLEQVSCQNGYNKREMMQAKNRARGTKQSEEEEGGIKVMVVFPYCNTMVGRLE